MRHFEIHGSALQPEKTWRLNITCHVVAENAQRALQLALDKHPEMDVHSLHHKGRVDIIQDVPNVEAKGLARFWASPA